MYLRWTLLVVLFAACASRLPHGALPPQGTDRVALEAAVATWRELGLGWSPLCAEEMQRVRVVIAEPTTFTELCRNRPSSAGGRLYACSTKQYENAWPVSLINNDYVPLLVISALQPQRHREELVVHEAMHWLGDCSGRGIDHAHADDRVWQGVLVAATERLHEAGDVDAGRARMALHRSSRRCDKTICSR